METGVAKRPGEISAKAEDLRKRTSGATPYTGIEALWDKVDGFQASLIISGGMAAIVLLTGLIMALFVG